MITSRRLFLGGLAAMFAAPAIVKASSLMPLRGEPLMTLHMRALTAYDCDWNEITRLDVLYGSFTARPEWTEYPGIGRVMSDAEFRALCGPQYPHDIRRVEALARTMPGEIIGADLYKLPEVLSDRPARWRSERPTNLWPSRDDLKVESLLQRRFDDSLAELKKRVANSMHLHTHEAVAERLGGLAALSPYRDWEDDDA